MKVDVTRLWKKFLVAGATAALVAGTVSTPPAANAAGTIKADDDKWISIGMGLRTSFNAVEGGSPAGHYTNEFTVDNARIYLNGKVHKNIGFEVTTECFNCSIGSGSGNQFHNANGSGTTSPNGGVGFGGNSSIGLLDAIGKIEINDAVNLWVGRMLLPTDRNTLNNAFYTASYSGLRDASHAAGYSSNFNAGAGLYGRDNAATIWGKVHPGGMHLLYAFAVSQGLRGAANNGNSLMYTGRLQLNLLNDEPMSGYYTAGTYYGTAGDIAAIAISGQHQKDGAGSYFNQSDVTNFSVDAMVEKLLPNNAGVFTFNGQFKRQWARYNQAAFTEIGNAIAGQEGCFCVFNGHSWTVQALYLVPAKIGIGRFQPYVQYTAINPLDSAARNEWQGGVNYVIDGHNARVAFFYTYGDIRSKGANYQNTAAGDKVDSFHVALQMQY